MSNKLRGRLLNLVLLVACFFAGALAATRLEPTTGKLALLGALLLAVVGLAWLIWQQMKE